MPIIDLEYVEHDADFVTCTDGLGQVHYLMHHHFDMKKIKGTKAGDKVEVKIPQETIDMNGIVEC